MQENQFYRFLVLVGKTFTGLVLLLLTMRMFSVTDAGAIYFGWLLLVFFTLPTVFIVFFKNMVIRKYPGFKKYWRILKMIYVIIVILFALLLIVGIVRYYQKGETAAAVGFINSQKITLDDVMGKNLPPTPDQALNDSTIAGIDENKNGIRDDVELAIFKKYPDSAKMRAAELQYAKALQLELTKTYNLDTWIAVLKEKLYSEKCMDKTEPPINRLNDSPEKINSFFALIDSRIKEVNDIVLNTNSRIEKQKLQKDYDTQMSIYTSIPVSYCDIELSSLPN